MNAWFRMYSEFASDPKVQSMSESMQRRLVMLLCLRSSDSLVTFEEQDIAFALRVTEQELAVTKEIFIQKGFVSTTWEITNWNKRQFVSDSSTERTRRYRERSKTSPKRHCDALDTEQIQNRTDKKPLVGKPRQKPGAESELWFTAEFWPHWIKAANDLKGAALKAAKSKAKTAEIRAEIMAVVMSAKFAASRRDQEPQFRKHAATWINQAGWEGLAPVVTEKPAIPGKPDVLRDEYGYPIFGME